MNTKMSKRQRDLKAKLMAAIAMLLVSSIMMVSTTYAWFTLSTAPEVTGITTAVGANGNLEMALQPGSGDLTEIKTGTSDSNLPDAQRNETWGNLVDLSDNATYGLNKITLYPAALNFINAEGEAERLNIANMLSYPEYGADGRIKLLNSNGALYGEYNGQSFVPGTTYGVRAIGAASGMSTRELNHRSMLNKANAAMINASTAAKNSLERNGGALAEIAILYGADKANYTDVHKESIAAMLTDLKAANGPFYYLQEAYKYYILTAVASSMNTAADDVVDLFVENYQDQTLADVQGALSQFNISLPAALQEGITAMEASYAKIATAEGKLKTLTGGSYTWTQMIDVLGTIADPEQMTVGGKTMDEFKAMFKADGIAAVLATFTSGVEITMPSGSGVYADIADQAENYVANIVVNSDTTISDIAIKGVKAKIFTAAKSSVLGNIHGLMAATSAPSSNAGGSVLPITDTYGYVIDMAFKTNAAGSSLVLQPEPTNRIYTGQTGMEAQGNNFATNSEDMESTMGTGASMTFAVTDSFSEGQMKNLMESIVIVFYETKTGNVISYGKLDAENAETVEAGLKAKIKAAERSTTDGTVMKEFTDEIVESTDAGYVTYKVYYADAEKETYKYRSHVNGENTVWERYVAATDSTSESWEAVTGTVDPAELKVAVKQTAGSLVISADNQIMELPQNTAVALSALVYLDGENVTNADVATSGTTSMTGTMSLQFSSSAQLIPMNYTPLMGTEKQGGSVTVESTKITTVNVVDVDGQPVSGAGATGTFTAKGEVTINVTGLADTQAIKSVKIGETAVSNPTISGAKVTFVNESMKADTVVTVVVGNKA